MARLVISPTAQDDLQEIRHYLAVENDNIDAALNLLQAIREALLLLTRFPQMGRRCREFEKYVPGLMMIPVQGYVIYYHRTNDNVIEVGRIVHMRRERERIIRGWHGS